jgi:hypothetical protein
LPRHSQAAGPPSPEKAGGGGSIDAACRSHSNIKMTKRYANFIEWVGKHIAGDEKGEAQIYLDRLFQAFDWPGLKEAGATCELRVKNDSGGTSFADTSRPSSEIIGRP